MPSVCRLGEKPRMTHGDRLNCRCVRIQPRQLRHAKRARNLGGRKEQKKQDRGKGCKSADSVPVGYIHTVQPDAQGRPVPVRSATTVTNPEPIGNPWPVIRRPLLRIGAALPCDARQRGGCPATKHCSATGVAELGVVGNCASSPPQSWFRFSRLI